MTSLHKNIEEYYTEKIELYGTTPKGVDWNEEDSQLLRFTQLLSIIDNDNFSIADIGCGYGKLSEHLAEMYPNFSYIGYDLSGKMIDSAHQLYQNYENRKFIHIAKTEDILDVDYSVASGIFNVKMEHSEADWLSYILHTLENMNQKSHKGFSFNVLTKYSDKEYMRNDLYYADPLFLFDYCKRNFSKNVALLHDYNLYEFTILVRKN